MVAIRIGQKYVDAMVAHAREDAPVECCGLIAARDGRVAALYRARNMEASPYRFRVDPLETKRLCEAMEDEGLELAGFYHSHTGSEAVPSPTDVRMMGPLFGPPYVHFVVGLKDPARPEVRAWFIADGDRSEQSFDVEP